VIETRPSILRILHERGVEAPAIALPGAPESPEPASSDSGRYVLGDAPPGAEDGACLTARDLDLGREVAIRVLPEGRDAPAERVRRFIEEARTGAGLGHPGVVPVFDLGVLGDGRPYYTMAVLKGEEFDAILARRRDPAEDRRRLLAILERLGHTIAYAHERGTVRPGLSSRSVRVGFFGEIGVSGWTRETDGGAERAADIRALGRILYAILTGGPEDDPEPERGLQRSATEGPLAALCRGALGLSPADHPGDAAGFVSVITWHLEAAGEREHRSKLRAIEDQARAARTRERTLAAEAGAKASRRAQRQVLSIVGLLLLAVVLAAGGWGWLGSERRGERAAARERVETALAEAQLALGRKDAATAVRAAGRAVDMARAELAGAEMLELANASRLDAEAALRTAEREAARAARDAALIEALAEVRAREGIAPDDETDRGYAAALAGLPEPPADLGPAAREAVSGALDAYERLPRRIPGETVPDADLLDDDPARREVRAAIRAGRTADLLDRVGEAGSVSPGAAALLGAGLSGAGEHGAAAEVLFTAVLGRPDDPWIHLERARALEAAEPPRTREAVRHLAAAVALRPRSADLRIRLARALELLGESDEAALHRAMAR
jgi:hypothetical protein